MAKKKATKKTRSSRSSRSGPDPKKRPGYVPGYQWDEAAATAPVQFIETLCRHPNEHGGEPTRIDLIDWQKEQVLRPLFGWRRPDGRLRYRRAGIFVPKKNRKSSIMSQLAQYIITCHAPAQDCFLAANDRLQARTMYRMIRQSVEASPKLSKMLEVVDSRRDFVQLARDFGLTAAAAARIPQELPSGEEEGDEEDAVLAKLSLRT